MQDRPALFSTFLMWLLADLFHDLPEVGDLDKPKLVFFFDEAHLLFNDASKAFLDQITQTVRLIRSKGVGVFFVTQTPKDVPDDVLAQLGNRGAARAARLHPRRRQGAEGDGVDLPERPATTSGAADRTLGHRRGGRHGAVRAGRPDARSPGPGCAHPQSLMAPAPADAIAAAVAASPLQAEYGRQLDRESAFERLQSKLAPPPAPAAPSPPAPVPGPSAPGPSAPGPSASGSSAPGPDDDGDRASRGRAREREEPSVVEQVVGSPMVRSFMRSAGSALGREITRSIFGTASRRRR